jgi:hypothetical protein
LPPSTQLRANTTKHATAMDQLLMLKLGQIILSHHLIHRSLCLFQPLLNVLASILRSVPFIGKDQRILFAIYSDEQVETAEVLSQIDINKENEDPAKIVVNFQSSSPRK